MMFVTNRVQRFFIFDFWSDSSRGTTPESLNVFDFVELFLGNQRTDHQKLIIVTRRYVDYPVFFCDFSPNWRKFFFLFSVMESERAKYFFLILKRKFSKNIR